MKNSLSVNMKATYEQYILPQAKSNKISFEECLNRVSPKLKDTPKQILERMLIEVKK